VTGTFREVEPESSVFDSGTPVQSTSIPFILVRSIQWIAPNKPARSFNIKQLLGELHETPSTTVRVELRHHRVLSGRIREAAELWIVLAAPESSPVQVLDYRQLLQRSASKLSSSICRRSV
jgi:hypothetical protein